MIKINFSVLLFLTEEDNAGIGNFPIEREPMKGIKVKKKSLAWFLHKEIGQCRNALVKLQEKWKYCCLKRQPERRAVSIGKNIQTPLYLRHFKVWNSHFQKF